MVSKVSTYSPTRGVLRDRCFHTHPGSCIGVSVHDTAEHYQRPQDSRGELQSARDKAQENGSFSRGYAI